MKEVLFSDYKGQAISKLDYEIYTARISSNCIIHENKLLDREKNIIVDAKGYCAADYHDGEYVNFKYV